MNTPFLRWAGGKRDQLDQIMDVLPQGKRLIEPFVGAGSVFMNAGFQENLINDVNPDLINLYSVLKKYGHKFIDEAEQLCSWCQTKEDYTRIRERFNTREYSSYSMAAFFLVLNRTSFNGLCRYNQLKEFNVHWGKKQKVMFPREALQAYVDSSRKVDMLCADFTRVMSLARSGDVVFADPPYQPMPGKSGFTTYSGTTFDIGAQKRLVAAAVELKKRGVPTVFTNSAAPIIIDIYTQAGFTVKDLHARRSVGASSKSRGGVKDIIAVLK